MEILEKIKQIASEEADKLGLKVYNVYFEGSGENKTLHIEVDKKGGITLKQVTDFTEVINPLLDQLEDLDFTYSLDCSSLGAERFIPIEELADHVNEYMELTLKDKKIIGTLEKLDEEELILKSFIKGRPHKDKVRKDEVSKIQLRIKF